MGLPQPAQPATEDLVRDRRASSGTRVRKMGVPPGRADPQGVKLRRRQTKDMVGQRREQIVGWLRRAAGTPAHEPIMPTEQPVGRGRLGEQSGPAKQAAEDRPRVIGDIDDPVGSKDQDLTGGRHDVAAHFDGGTQLPPGALQRNRTVRRGGILGGHDERSRPFSGNGDPGGRTRATSVVARSQCQPEGRGIAERNHEAQSADRGVGRPYRQWAAAAACPAPRAEQQAMHDGRLYPALPSGARIRNLRFAPDQLRDFVVGELVRLAGELDPPPHIAFAIRPAHRSGFPPAA
ncbi:hypothetical protein [Actinoplanes subtropicus]|uniref:hypothetical protein n=1 Tax=Actinoplanes subtropicus TaxID=543632 RepID=UPI00146FD9FC|nr:hypothetical protein [Actinoplanes subtropicus]